MIRRRHGKTPYELLHDKPPDLSYLHVFGALCYPTNDSENLGKLQPKADIGLVPNPPSSTPFVPPSRSDWDLLFQPMFDESLNVDLHAPEVIAPIPEAVAPEHAASVGPRVYRQERIDFAESYASEVARLEAIENEFFLAFAAHMKHGHLPNGCEDCVYFLNVGYSHGEKSKLDEIKKGKL
ncbi:hypothetical protein Tco_0570782 [Tanacetum coccineum]